MNRFQRSTVDLIAAAVPVGIAMTPREIEKRLAIFCARSTVRAVLIQLSVQGRVVMSGDITQRRYRLAGNEP